MLNLTLEGWLDGATALLIVCFGSIVAIIILVISRKIQAELLPYGAIMAWFASLLWLAPATDFLTILGTGHNMDNDIGNGLYGILSYMWVAPTLITALYLGAKLLIPEKRKVVLIMYIILGIVFEIFLFAQTAASFVFTMPPLPGDVLIDARFNYAHPTFYFIAAFLCSVIGINVVGSLYRAKNSAGKIRTKFTLLAVVFLLFVVVAVFDALLSPGPVLFVARLGMLVCAVLIYKVLKP
ncbi:MAG: hypothetical protein Q6373_008000 [Candidatus Sigynarchaeota archaeon]